MDEAVYLRYQDLASQYSLDRCREIAASFLERADLPDADRIRAAGVLNALDAADHSEDLMVIQVSRFGLLLAALEDVDRLWTRYGEREPSEYRQVSRR